jgi:hypothetical protein
MESIRPPHQRFGLWQTERILFAGNGVDLQFRNLAFSRMYDDSDTNPFGRAPLRVRDNVGRAVSAGCTHGEIDSGAAASTSADYSEFGDLRLVLRHIGPLMPK